MTSKHKTFRTLINTVPNYQKMYNLNKFPAVTFSFETSGVNVRKLLCLQHYIGIITKISKFQGSTVKLISRKTSLATLRKLRMPPIGPFTLIKKLDSFNPIYLIQLLIKQILLCINTFACLKINQCSTGLFVSYSSEKPNCMKLLMQVSI